MAVAAAEDTPVEDLGEDEEPQEVITLRDEYEFRCPRVRGIRPPSNSSDDEDEVMDLRQKLEARNKAVTNGSQDANLRDKLNRSRSIDSNDTIADVSAASDQVTKEPGSERSLLDQSPPALDNSVEILNEIPTPSPMSSLTTPGEPIKTEVDLRRKLDMSASSRSSDDSVMDTSGSEESKEVTLLHQVSRQGAVVMGNSFRKITLPKAREAMLNMSNLRLGEEELSDGNLSDSLVIDEYPENSNRKTEKVLEKMFKEPLPMAICHVSDNVLALLDYTEEEMENLREDVLPATTPDTPNSETVTIPDNNSTGGNTDNGDAVKKILILKFIYYVLTLFLLLTTGCIQPRPVKDFLEVHLKAGR